MKIVSILYFSGTGNTWWASEHFAEQLNSTMISASALSIESGKKLTNKAIKESDIVFLNYPVYGSDRPEIIKDFIASMPDLTNTEGSSKQFGIICTQMMFSGDGAWLEHELIENKGYKIQWAIHLRMPNNISIPGFPFRFTNNRSKLDIILDKASLRLQNLADLVTDEKPLKQGTSLISRLLGLMQRGPYRKMFPILRDDLTIDPFTCTKCGQCIQLCPVENIIFADESIGGFPEFQGKCNLCLRCYNFCPGQSILYRNKRFKPGRGPESLPYSGPVPDFVPAVLKKPT